MGGNKTASGSPCSVGARVRGCRASALRARDHTPWTPHLEQVCDEHLHSRGRRQPRRELRRVRAVHRLWLAGPRGDGAAALVRLRLAAQCVASRRVVSCCVVSCRVVSCCVVLCCVVLCCVVVWCVVLCCVVLCCVVLCCVVLCCVVLCCVVLCCVVLCCVVLCVHECGVRVREQLHAHGWGAPGAMRATAATTGRGTPKLTSHMCAGSYLPVLNTLGARARASARLEVFFSSRTCVHGCGTGVGGLAWSRDAAAQRTAPPSATVRTAPPSATTVRRAAGRCWHTLVCVACADTQQQHPTHRRAVCERAWRQGVEDPQQRVLVAPQQLQRRPRGEHARQPRVARDVAAVEVGWGACRDEACCWRACVAGAWTRRQQQKQRIAPHNLPPPPPTNTPPTTRNTQYATRNTQHATHTC
jgi:hypothetical protein